MSLDPQAQAVLEALQAIEFPAWDSITAPQLREMTTLPLADTADDGIRVKDHIIDGANGDIRVRVYQPNLHNQHYPLLLFFHGGGFVIGNLDGYDALCRKFCLGVNAVVVSVEYRLAPEHKFPQGLQDCYAATCWASNNAASLAADPTRLVVMGDSAGGCLAAVVSQMARARASDPQAPTIAHQVLIYPVTDCSFETTSYRENAEGYFLTREMMQWFWDHYLNDISEKNSSMACPLRAQTFIGLPEATIITAELDPLRDEGAAYFKRLVDARVKADYHCYKGVFHGFINYFDLMTVAENAIEHICQRLKNTVV
jgi:acetyl esterase/lipase